ncbi:MAG TPA: sugar phosphate nucleotidyltransferase [Allosphingosinicella sp.]|jgi:mannose-1-phosphate guanylyltransferase/mannose-1-phosphate guanylyltransferase/mannose-6-phosphate isomerase
MNQAARITPVILSGGSGTRLWPLSRADRLKQFLTLSGEHSLIQQTALRVADPALFAAPMVVAGAAQGPEIEAQLAAAGVAHARLVLEPAARNTAPAIALAAFAAAPDDLLLVLPSDHFIADPVGFCAHVAAARPAAEEGWLVTFGMTPDRPETGYGYIRPGDPIGGGLSRVEAFVEKPDRAAAEAWLAAGSHLWNSGIFLFRASAFLDALAAHAPDIHAAASAGDAVSFAAAPKLSIDVAVMEKHGRVAVRPAAFGWSDVGSWESLHAILPHDAAGNAVAGDVVTLDVSNCLIRSDGPVIAAIGVSDLVIVATERAILIVPRDQSQRAQEAIAALTARERPA